MRWMGMANMRANVTRDAKGFARRSFTAAEILRMQDAGRVDLNVVPPAAERRVRS